MEKNIDVYIKDEGDFAGIIMMSEKAKKTANDHGFKNQYDFMPNQYRIDVLYEDIHKIEKWSKDNNLVFETEY